MREHLSGYVTSFSKRNISEASWIRQQDLRLLKVTNSNLER
jgi:hypothetical protein